MVKAKLLSVVSVLGLFSVLSAVNAQAVQLNFQGGAAFPSPTATYEGPARLLGGEVLTGFGGLKLGAFYEHTAYKYKAGGNAPNTFYGVVGRLSFGPAIPIFVDAKMGPTWTDTSEVSVGYGFGAGYDFSFIPALTIAPRIGYRILPFKVGNTTSDLKSFDITLLLGLGF